MITDSETKSMITELERVIREEEAKPESERDADLIDDCIREIAELKGVKAEFSAEEVAEITDNLIKAAKREQRRKRFVRLAAGIAAAVVLVTGITACTINPALINWFVKIVRMPLGSTVKQESITYYYQGTSKEYKSVEELFKDNNLDVFYPTIFPDHVKLKTVEILDENGIKTVYFKFSPSDIYYIIQLQCTNPIADGEIATEIETADLHFIVYPEKDVYLSCAEDSGNTYILQSKSISDTILIISGLRKDNK